MVRIDSVALPWSLAPSLLGVGLDLLQLTMVVIEIATELNGQRPIIEPFDAQPVRCDGFVLGREPRLDKIAFVNLWMCKPIDYGYRCKATS